MAINFLNLRASLEEKTLTPAEKKKREEVAKAIHRENPNMPMGMKMAIATKTAKRVAEEEELGEATAEKAMKQHHKWVKSMEGETSDTVASKLKKAKDTEASHQADINAKLKSGEVKHRSPEHKELVSKWNRLSRTVSDLQTKHSWLKEKENKKNVSEENNIVAVIDGKRSDRKYNDADHAHNSLSKLVGYQKAKKAELYVNGEKTKHYELNKKYNDFEPKKLSEENTPVSKAKHFKTLLNRHTELAIAANKDGDHEAVKYHQAKMNAAKSQMAKLAKEDVEQGEHYCAKHVYSELFGEGQVVEADHAEPDETGNIEWYNVQFTHGVEKVFTEDIEIMVAEYHANHKRKKRKMMEDDNG